MNKPLLVFLACALAAAACAAPAATNTPAPANTPVAPTAAAPTAAPTQAPALTATAAVTTAATTAAAQSTETAPPAAATGTLAPGTVDPARYAFTAVAQGFKSPVLVTNAGDGSGRLFVVEQDGLIRIVQNGAALPTPFIDLTSLAAHNSSERGLLGLAFDPHYAQTGQFYVYYTDASGDIHLVRYHVSAGDPNQADPASAQVLLTVAHHTYPNHNGGNLVFGPDGYLYMDLGDGGSQGDPNGNGQNLGVLLGKILRLDVSGGGNYSVPPSNPFVGKSGAKGEIWAYGLRNPWRATFDRATGDLWIGDVGQDTYEEIDVQPTGDKGGEDYGWNIMEGLHSYPKGQASTGATLTAPVAEYSHQEGGCSVTGGYVYRGPSLPELAGVYFFGDYCSGMIWTLVKSGDAYQRALFVSSGFTISSFGQDEAGELYVCDYGGGVIYRLARAP